MPSREVAAPDWVCGLGGMVAVVIFSSGIRVRVGKESNPDIELNTLRNTLER